MQFVLYQVMSYEAETLLPEKKRNTTGLKETENSHGNVLAALKTPGTFNKHNTKNKGRGGHLENRARALLQRPQKDTGLSHPFHSHSSNLENEPPHLEPGSLSVTFSLKCPTYVTEMCTNSSLLKETSSLAGTLFLPAMRT